MWAVARFLLRARDRLCLGQRQLITGGLLGIADVKAVTDNHRVVPGLSIQRLERGHFGVLAWIRPQKEHPTILRRDQQQAGILQQQHLAFAVASAFPFPIAGFEIHTGEDVAIVALSQTFISH